MLTIRELIKTLYNAFIQKLKKHRGNWEQNDPTADDYIKNRPFYIDGCTTIVKDKTFKTYYEGEWCLPFVFKPITGEIYKVIWNGKEYECIAYLNSHGYVCIGNEGLVENIKDTGEPFLYFYNKNSEDFGLYVKNAGTHTISIDKLNVKKIDKKFIDMSDTIDKLAPVAFSGNYWDLYNIPPVNTHFSPTSYDSISGRGVANALNRQTRVNSADTNYTTYMARGTSLNNKETNPTVNGTIAWTYE